MDSGSDTGRQSRLGERTRDEIACLETGTAGRSDRGANCSRETHRYEPGCDAIMSCLVSFRRNRIPNTSIMIYKTLVQKQR